MRRRFGWMAFLVLTVSASWADEPATTSKIRVYHMADLAAREAVYSAGPAIVERSREDLQTEHAETLAALERLANLVETMVPSGDGGVGIRPESLSLVVRRTPEEHEEIASLLEELRKESEPKLELSALLLVEGASTPEANAAQEELGQLYVRQFESQGGISPEDVEHVRDIMQKTGGPMSALPAVHIRNGFRTIWGMSSHPLSVTALENGPDNHVVLRIDARINDPANGPVKVRTSKLEVKLGHSFLYSSMADDDEGVYLVTIRRRGETKPAVTAAVEGSSKQ